MERCGIAASQHTAHQNPHHPIIPDVRVRVAYTYPYQARRTIEILRRIHGARLRMNVPGTLVLYNCSTLFCFSFFFPHPIYYLRPSFFPLPPSRNSDAGSHSRLFSPLPTTVRALHLYREEI